MALKYNYDEDYDYSYSEPVKKRKQKTSHVKFCHFQGKIIYRTRKVASERLKEIMVEREEAKDFDRVERNIYQCPHCDFFHLTSQKGKVFQDSKKRKQLQADIFNRSLKETVEYSPERVNKIRKLTS